MNYFTDPEYSILRTIFYVAIAVAIYFFIKKYRRQNSPIIVENIKGVESGSSTDDQIAYGAIIVKGNCPECDHHHPDNMWLITAQGGAALNIQCVGCKQKYWFSPDFALAYKIGILFQFVN